jgi:hypothetical protein
VKSNLKLQVQEHKEFLCVLEFVSRVIGIGCEDPSHNAKPGIQCLTCIDELLDSIGSEIVQEKDKRSRYSSLLKYGAVSRLYLLTHFS